MSLRTVQRDIVYVILFSNRNQLAYNKKPIQIFGKMLTYKLQKLHKANKIAYVLILIIIIYFVMYLNYINFRFLIGQYLIFHSASICFIKSRQFSETQLYNVNSKRIIISRRKENTSLQQPSNFLPGINSLPESRNYVYKQKMQD